MTRGEIWTVAGGSDYAGKARPAVIMQADQFDDIESVTICPFTTVVADAPGVRIQVEPSTENGLEATSYLMADKLTTLRKDRLGYRIGSLEEPSVRELSRAVVLFLGLADPGPTTSS